MEKEDYNKVDFLTLINERKNIMFNLTITIYLFSS